MFGGSHPRVARSAGAYSTAIVHWGGACRPRWVGEGGGERTRRDVLRGGAVMAACAFLLAVGVASARAASNRTTLRGSAPAWADARHQAGPADSAGTVRFRVYMG